MTLCVIILADVFHLLYVIKHKSYQAGDPGTKLYHMGVSVHFVSIKHNFFSV